MEDIRRKNAILTGGSKGIGPIIAETLAEEGVNLALAARSENKLREVTDKVKSLGVRAISVPADVTDEDSLKNLVSKTLKEFGSIDILVNNAGIEWVSRYTALSTEHIKRIITTNLMGPMVLTRFVLPHMLERGSGHVVTMSSLGGKKGSPYSATYAATKAGLIAWTSSIRTELRGSGVSASVICPTFISDVGMFAVYNKKAPWMVGEVKPDKVAMAVVKAIKNDIQEILVTPGPARLFLMIDALCPGIISSILRLTGVYKFYKGQADDNERFMADEKTNI